MPTVPQHHDKRTTPPVTENRRQWAALIFQASEDAAATRQQMTVRDRQIAELHDVAAIPWNWDRDEQELQFILYFSQCDATNLVAFELVGIDDEPPSPQQRLRFERQLQVAVDSAADLFEAMVSKAAESLWPLP